MKIDFRDILGKAGKLLTLALVSTLPMLLATMLTPLLWHYRQKGSNSFTGVPQSLLTIGGFKFFFEFAGIYSYQIDSRIGTRTTCLICSLVCVGAVVFTIMDEPNGSLMFLTVALVAGEYARE